ncbi:unnamed protein product [Paramecium octaurelia]|uniref:LisH domain-containing protein ARMC9 n=1 Tax=Paramecium octaurelia TaxID=43137 RepID=A0A8S1SEB6_PAROT|nr:unnamed protein product [Paramecium octaurelia]
MSKYQPPTKKKVTKQTVPQQSKKQEQQQEQLYIETILDPTQESIISLIQEYLVRYQLLNTLDTLSKELASGQMGAETYHLDSELLEYFDKGQYEMFFMLWNKYLPYNLRMKDDDAKKLEFYIQIYFLIYEIHPKTGKKGGVISKAALHYFKTYLDTKGQELSKTTEFLPYYALPYVQRPQEHQTYKHLFQNQWILETKGKLVRLTHELLNREQLTVMEQMYQNFTDEPKKVNLTSSNQNYTTNLGMNNQELLAVIQDYNLKYNQMQKKFRDYIEQSKQTMIEAQQKWFQLNKEVTDIANQLNKMLEDSRKGNQVPQNQLDEQLKKLAKLSQFFSTSVEEIISQSQDISMYDKVSIFENDLSISPIPQHSQQLHFNFNQPQIPYVQLNYSKIKSVFQDSSSDPGFICRILQALRFRITTAKGARVRREILIQYAQFDILGCTPGNTAVLQRLLVDAPNSVKEYTLRLTNAMASDYQGRSYLMASFTLIKTLIDILKKEKDDSLVRRNALGALQKLSLRRRPQVVMIENDVIKWIVKTLENEKESLSEYSYEYATALFMNLSMRDQGKQKCVEFKRDVLKVLNELLEHDNMQVRTFVNGTLYSLFSISQMREQAQALGMKERLVLLMQNSDDRFIKQIQYILEQINKIGPDELEPDEDNDVDDIDDIDDSEDTIEEEDAEDALKAKDGELVGEELLNAHFSLSHQEAIQQNTMTRSIIMQENQNKKAMTPKSSQQQPFRPTTPVISASQLQKSQLPSEMKPRPKLARTPVGQDRPTVNFEQSEQQFQQQQQSMKSSQQNNNSQQRQPIPEIKPAIEAPLEQPSYERNDEYKNAFQHKPKIPRTPPQK